MSRIARRIHDMRQAPKLLCGVAVAMMLSLHLPYGTAEAKNHKAAQSAVSLAGRWTGLYYGYGKRSGMIEDVKGGANTLTFDIVACDGGWCGIRVLDNTTCSTVALHLKPDASQSDKPVFKGNMQLEKETAQYTVQARYWLPNEEKEEKAPTAHLSFIGDTGGRMLLMRRSFPLQANLARTGDAVCTLEKATS